MSHVEFKEIEVKHRSIDIKLKDFRELSETLNPKSSLDVSGYDYYFVNNNDRESFIRYRAGDKPELTMKKKLKDSNNFVRVEINLPLSKSQAKEDQLKTVTAFCEMLNFDRNFSIYKNCAIYFYDTFNLVYYVVYDEDLKEKDRFIEIEMYEDAPWSSVEAAWAELVKIEQQLKPLGITAQSRIRKSLYEMFRK